MSLKKTKAVCAASKWQYAAAGQEVNVCLGVVFTSDGRRNNVIDRQIGKANAVLRELRFTVVTKRERVRF